MFKEELEDLKNRYMTRLVLHHVFSDEPPIRRSTWA
jgi:ring-1,2-phenylacetyl-CoA epoxidase subunit PaaE